MVLGVLLGLALAPSAAAGVLVGICLTSTALGTIMPVLRDAGQLDTPFGTAVTAIGAVGEFGPLLAVALFLSGRSPAAESVLLVFAALIALSLVLAGRPEMAGLHRVIEATLHSSGQFAVRLIVLVSAFTGLASAFRLDVLLGAFAVGVLIRVLLRTGEPAAVEVVETGSTGWVRLPGAGVLHLHAAALVGAGMLSVLVFPLLALAVARRTRGG